MRGQSEAIGCSLSFINYKCFEPIHLRGIAVYSTGEVKNLEGHAFIAEAAVRTISSCIWERKHSIIMYRIANINHHSWGKMRLIFLSPNWSLWFAFCMLSSYYGNANSHQKCIIRNAVWSECQIHMLYVLDIQNVHIEFSVTSSASESMLAWPISVAPDVDSHTIR